MNPIAVSGIETIDAFAKAFADRREILAERVQALQDELEAVKRRRLGGIKCAAAEAAFAKSELDRAIQEHPELFNKPRTMVLHGIKLGMVEGKGAIDFVDEAKVIARIEKLLPEQKDILVKTTQKLVKKALRNLEAATLAKIGCTVEKAGDQVLIKAASDEIDKLVAKILEEGSENAAETVAAA